MTSSVAGKDRRLKKPTASDLPLAPPQTPLASIASSSRYPIEIAEGQLDWYAHALSFVLTLLKPAAPKDDTSWFTKIASWLGILSGLSASAAAGSCLPVIDDWAARTRLRKAKVDGRWGSDNTITNRRLHARITSPNWLSMCVR
jgi:hypothetical protein